MSKSPEELYKEREQRYNDAVAIKEPDRVPLAPLTGYWPCLYKGMIQKEAMFDHSRTAAAFKEVTLELNWDMCVPFLFLFSGPLFKSMRMKQMKAPGIDLPDNVSHQHVEAEYMYAEEYKELFDNPSDFTIRKYLPRVWGAFEVFETLPPLDSYLGMGAILTLPMLGAQPAIFEAMEALKKGGEAMMQWMGVEMAYEAEMKSLGFPALFGSAAVCPFDVVSDFLRGMRGTMIDMYRRPEDLKRLMDLVGPHMTDMAINMAKMANNPRVFVAIHRGSDPFLSDEQFAEFYWPGLKKLLLDFIDAGLTTMLFMEGDCTSRIKYLKELPKGKVIAMLDTTDIFWAKKEIGDRVCLKGNVPAQLLCAGTPAQVDEYCKKLIEVVGEGGGYMMDGAVTGIPDEAKPENVKAMCESVFKYGVYRK